MSELKKRRDLYQEVTDKIIAAFESGTAPWQRGWSELAELGLPMNGQSSRQYNGINSVLLFLTSQERSYSDPRWFTFKQANEMGAKVRKGEKSTPVYFFKMLQASAQDGNVAKGETPRMIPFLTEYRIFNAQQVEGIEPLHVPERKWTPIQAVEQVVERMQPRIQHGGNRAFYSPSQDYIQMPHQNSFPSAAEYSGTLLHEISHWSGHATRLSRQFGVWGSDEYAREEIRADLANCYLSAQLGVPMQLENNAAYIGSFVKRLKEDKFEIFRAAKDAQRICDYLTGRYVPEKEVSPEIVPVVSPAPVIETTVRPVSPLVKSMLASNAKRQASRKPKTGYTQAEVTAEETVLTMKSKCSI